MNVGGKTKAFIRSERARVAQQFAQKPSRPCTLKWPGTCTDAGSRLCLLFLPISIGTKKPPLRSTPPAGSTTRLLSSAALRPSPASRAGCTPFHCAAAQLTFAGRRPSAAKTCPECKAGIRSLILRRPTAAEMWIAGAMRDNHMQHPRPASVGSCLCIQGRAPLLSDWTFYTFRGTWGGLFSPKGNQLLDSPAFLDTFAKNQRMVAFYV